MKRKDLEAAIAELLNLDSDEVVVTQALDNGHVSLKISNLELDDSTEAEDDVEIDDEEDEDLKDLTDAEVDEEDLGE